MKNNRKTELSRNLNDLLDPLESILFKRNGGAINIRGIHYQALYACHIVLKELSKTSENSFVRLEGIEDIDLNVPQLSNNNYEYIQLKSSNNKLDAGTFWNLGVLQNFLEIYRKEPNSKFKLVYNMKIADGNLKALIDKNLNTNSEKFWFDKLKLVYENENIDYQSFIKTISFEYISLAEISNQILKSLYQYWGINKGTEDQFLRSLFYNILIWSKDRVTIRKKDIELLFQEIIDSYSKASINQATKNDWIKPIVYSANDNKDYSSYYEGKAAMPIHIAKELPARRKIWEKQIETKLKGSDVVIIKSSSGQGKSTLAWQTCFNLKNDYTIYQIQFCPDWNSVNSIVEFIESRVQIGQRPLIIFDGLDSLISYWPYVVERTISLPVKYLITTRNEDWYRYGADVSKINLQIIDINLSLEEAKDIFIQLKNKDKLHEEVSTWQPAWEQIQNSGLLIEYTYLLTKGEMIRERLISQIKNLNKSQSASSKLEILRLVSLADCMNIKVKTNRLVDFIANSIGFFQDRGEILTELENEYFLNFQTNHISGLHPVRSLHLKELLHQTLPIESSLMSLYRIIDENYKYDFYVNIPLLLSSDNKSEFYDVLAKQLSQEQFSDMVMALDGILHVEPQMYWLKNRQIFDEAFNTRGIELFSMITIPFTEEAIIDLDNLANSIGPKFSSNLNYLSQKAKELSKHTLKDTDTHRFASRLQSALKSRETPVSSYSGLEFLMKWFNKLHIPLELSSHLLSNIELRSFFDNINSFDLQEAKEIALYFQSADPNNYKKYLLKKQDVIISYLKTKTNSLTIKVIKNDIHINYLLYGDEVLQANDLSVDRIQTIYVFFPYYRKYCTEAILLPFPNEEIISTVKQNSIKHMSSDTIYNTFDVHLNQIWYTTILKNYEELSAYDWQKNIITLRKEAMNLVRYCSQFIDSLLEGNQSKINLAIKKLTDQSVVFSTLYSTKKKYPTFNKKYFDKNTDTHNEKEINSWFSSISNVNNQLTNFFKPETEHDRHIALINLKASYFDLEKMQSSFNNIEAMSFKYFDSPILDNKEKAAYERLYMTVQYYISKIPLENKPAVLVAKKVAKDWWYNMEKEKLRSFHRIFDSINKNGADYKFYYPIKFEETSTLTTATIGIGDIDFSDVEILNHLLLNLHELADFPSDFYEIINVQNGVAISGVRFQREFFQKIKDILLEEDIDLMGLSPLPIFPDEETLKIIPNIILPDKTENDITKENKVAIILELWKLYEYRTRLNRKSEFESKWLEKIEINYQTEINSLMLDINDSLFIDWINEKLREESKLTIDIIITKLGNILIDNML